MGTNWNLVFICGFGALAVYIFYCYFKSRGKVQFKDRQYSGFRISFAIVGALSMLSFFTEQNTGLDYLREVILLFVVVGYLLTRDGIGDEGIVCTGKYYPWAMVRMWDYAVAKKSFNVYFEVKDKKDERSQAMISFDLKDQQQILEYLRKTQQRKYTRMKKA